MPDPGYGANGERTDPSGLVVWEANAPPVPVTEGYDTHMVFALGVRVIPFVDQDDDDVWQLAPYDSTAEWVEIEL